MKVSLPRTACPDLLSNSFPKRFLSLFLYKAEEYDAGIVGLSGIESSRDRVPSLSSEEEILSLSSLFGVLSGMQGIGVGIVTFMVSSGGRKDLPK